MLVAIKPLPVSVWMDLIGPIKEKYWVRLASSVAIYRAEKWKFEINDAGEITVVLHGAIVRDSQNRGPEFAPRVSAEPSIPLSQNWMVSVIGSHVGYHIPLPRACSLYFEWK